MADDREPTIDEIVAQFKNSSGSDSDEAVKSAIEHSASLEVFKALRAAGFQPNYHMGYDGPAFSEVVDTADAPLISYFLSQGADPNVSWEYSALAQAAGNPDVSASTVSELLDHGAKPNDGHALHLAAASASFDKVQVLLEHGAKPGTLYSWKNVQYHRRKQGLARGNALHEAAGAHWMDWKAEHEHSEVNEWDPDAQERVIKLLLEAGVDRQSQDDQGRRPVEWVVNGPGWEEPKWKAVLGSGAKTFDKEKHLQSLKGLLGG